jgi:hypothetical protein
MTAPLDIITASFDAYVASLAPAPASHTWATIDPQGRLRIET